MLFRSLRCSFSRAFVAGAKVLVSVRPENIKLAPQTAGAGENIVEGRVKDRSVWLGLAEYSIDVGGVELRVRAAVNGKAISPSETVRLELAPEKCVVVSTNEGGLGDEPTATL